MELTVSEIHRQSCFKNLTTTVETLVKDGEGKVFYDRGHELTFDNRPAVHGLIVRLPTSRQVMYIPPKDFVGPDEFDTYVWRGEELIGMVTHYITVSGTETVNSRHPIVILPSSIEISPEEEDSFDPLVKWVL